MIDRNRLGVFGAPVGVVLAPRGRPGRGGVAETSLQIGRRIRGSEHPGERAPDLGHGLQRSPTTWTLAQDLLTDPVQRRGDARTHVAWGEPCTIGADRHGGQPVGGATGVVRSQRRVEDASDVVDIGLRRVGGAIGRRLQYRLDPETDDLHISGGCDHDALGGDALVIHALCMHAGKGVGDLTGQPAGLQRTHGAVGQYAGQGLTGGVFADDERPVGGVVIGLGRFAAGVEDTQESRIGGDGRAAGGLEELVIASIATRQEIQHDRTREHLIGRHPALRLGLFGKDLLQHVTPGQALAGRCVNGSPGGLVEDVRVERGSDHRGHHRLVVGVVEVVGAVLFSVVLIEVLVRAVPRAPGRVEQGVRQ